jgi:hypothetical protein
MKVIGHDHINVDPPRAAAHGPTEAVLQPLAVVVVANDVLAAVAAGHHVLDGGLVLQA